MLLGKKAQAATELAVLGSLIIVAFSYLIMYSEKLNRDQANIMSAFRSSLARAGGTGSANYSKITHRRMANVANPYQLGQMDTYSASGSVLWGVGGSSSSLIDIDGTIIDAPTAATGTSTDTTVSDTDSTSVITKGQSVGGNIRTTRTLSATDEVTMGEYGVTTTLGDGGKYSGGGLKRSRTWSTPED